MNTDDYISDLAKNTYLVIFMLNRNHSFTAGIIQYKQISCVITYNITYAQQSMVVCKKINICMLRCYSTAVWRAPNVGFDPNYIERLLY